MSGGDDDRSAVLDPGRGDDDHRSGSLFGRVERFADRWRADDDEIGDARLGKPLGRPA